MKKFRRFWMIFFDLAVLVFIAYKGMQMIKTDSSGPVISGGGDKIEVSIHDGEDVLLQGITAADKKDGDVTNSLLVESISNFYDDHTRTVTYAAFDSDNHISKVEREITYSDYTKPKFELSGSLRFRAGETVNIDTIVKATDCLDGDLSNKIKIHMDTTINNRMTGFYQVVYEVSNSAGDNVKLPIDVEIYEPYNNEVELTLDRYLVYYEGKAIDYKAFLKSIRKGNLEYAFEGAEPLDVQTPVQIPVEEPEAAEEEAIEGEDVETTEAQSTFTEIPKSRVRVDDRVDTSKPGVYPVYYYYTDDHGTYTSEAKEVLYVVVE